MEDIPLGFILILFGFFVYRRNAPLGISTVIGVIGIAVCMYIGLNWHPIYLSGNVWMIIVGLYIAIASVTPVWILLQPRDYLSSFLLYGMIGTSGIRILVESQVDYGKSRNMAMTSVIFVVGLSGITVQFGSIQLSGMVLACVIGMLMGLMFYVLDKLKLTNDRESE